MKTIYFGKIQINQIQIKEMFDSEVLLQCIQHKPKGKYLEYSRNRK